MVMMSLCQAVYTPGSAPCSPAGGAGGEGELWAAAAGARALRLCGRVPRAAPRRDRLHVLGPQDASPGAQQRVAAGLLPGTACMRTNLQTLVPEGLSGEVIDA